MNTDNILKLVKAIDAGRIHGGKSHRVLGIGISQFWVWVREARRLGVVIDAGAVGGRQKDRRAWRIKNRGPFHRGDGR